MLLSAKEVGIILGINRRTVIRAYFRTGEIPAGQFGPGRMWRATREAVVRYIKQQQTKPKA